MAEVVRSSSHRRTSLTRRKPASKPRRRKRRSQPPGNGRRRGSTRRTRRCLPPSAEGSNESEGADGAEEFPVSQASQVDGDDDPAKVEDDAAPATEEEDWEDNERSERRFGYNPDRVVDPWAEYQAVMEDPMLAY